MSSFPCRCEQGNGDGWGTARCHLARFWRRVDDLGKVEILPAEPFGQSLCHEAPATRTDDRRGRGKSVSLGETARCMIDLGKLAVCEVAGERHPFAKLPLACVTPKHAGEPRRALRRALSALVCGRVGVGVVGKIAGKPPDIGHGSEALRRDALHATS